MVRDQRSDAIERTRKKAIERKRKKAAICTSYSFYWLFFSSFLFGFWSGFYLLHFLWHVDAPYKTGLLFSSFLLFLLIAHLPLSVLPFFLSSFFFLYKRRLLGQRSNEKESFARKERKKEREELEKMMKEKENKLHLSLSPSLSSALFFFFFFFLFVIFVNPPPND